MSVYKDIVKEIIGQNRLTKPSRQELDDLTYTDEEYWTMRFEEEYGTEEELKHYSDYSDRPIQPTPICTCDF